MASPLNQLKDGACRAVEAQRATLIELSTRIHRCPELQFEEHRA